MAAVAGRQYGLVTRAQLRGLGVGARPGSRSGCAPRRLHRVHRGVYAVGHAVLPALGARPRGRAGLRRRSGRVSHVAARRISGSGRARPRWSMSQCRGAAAGGHRRGSGCTAPDAWHAEDVTVHEGIPVTTLARTLLDLADVLERPSAQASDRRGGIPAAAGHGRPHCRRSPQPGPPRRPAAHRRHGPARADRERPGGPLHRARGASRPAAARGSAPPSPAIGPTSTGPRPPW